MRVFGLTGKTGAGKSTVASKLKEKGCFIIDGDVVAREIVLPGKGALEKLCEVFGEDILLGFSDFDNIFSVLKEHNCQLGLLYFMISFRNEGKIKTLSDEGN